MINLQTLALFSISAFVLIATPGPNQIYIITQSISQGRRAGLLSSLGVDMGTLVHVAAASLGVSALLASSALAFSVVKYAGAIYLIYLGFSAWRAKTTQHEFALSKPISKSRLFFQGMLTNVLNPKVALFFLAFLPQFVDPSSSYIAEQMLLLGIIFTLIGSAVDLTVALLASSIGSWMRQKTGAQQIQKRVAGAVYIVLGVSIALTDTSK